MKEMKQTEQLDVSVAAGMSRRRFFGMAGGLAGAGMLLGAVGCKKDDKGNGGVNLGSGDTGVLNYAYALEQLEAAFYTQVIATPYANMGNEERARLMEIRDHEIAHREFFKAALASSAIPALEVNFTAINFNDRNSVLTTARAFEDLGVSAYNGAGKLISNADYLTLAGKIVSVEARHAAYIRDMIENGTFAGSDVVDADGLDLARTPAQVLAIAKAFIRTGIDISNLPTS